MHQRLVEWRMKVAVAVDAAAGAQSLCKRAAKRQRDVFHCVVIFYPRVAFRIHFDVE